MSGVLHSVASRDYIAAEQTSSHSPGENVMAKRNSDHLGLSTTGLVLHWANRYDVLAWILLHGRERAFRERIVDLARLGPAEFVLDVGCGTGSLVIAAKRRVGPAGLVAGIDASPEMIA